jgi:hypothetical protein
LKKYIFIAVALVCVGLVLPSTRPRVINALGPIPGWVKGATKSAKKPFLGWIARGEAKHLIVGLKETQARGHPMPKPREFDKWSKERLSDARGGLDPWGNKYVMLQKTDSFVVVSAGPDNTMDTPDDIHASAPKK